MFDRFGKAIMFSKPDLNTGSHQIRVCLGDIYKTALHTKYGQFAHLEMPFEFHNVPATLQSLMNRMSLSWINFFLVFYLDDLLTLNNDEKDHLKYLEIVLGHLEEHILYISSKKCKFMNKEIDFLWFLVGKKGLT